MSLRRQVTWSCSSCCCCCCAGGVQLPVYTDAAEDSDFDEAANDHSSSDGDEAHPAPKKTSAGAKQRKQQKAPKQPKDKTGPRIGAKKAKKVYMLDDTDLRNMKDVKYSGNMFFGECACCRKRVHSGLKADPSRALGTS